jgi:hypothetical protein
MPDGAGPWKIYGGPSPFSGYQQSQRPEDATQLCSLVANPDHSVQPESGTCFELPDVVLASALLDTNCLSGPDPAFSVASQLAAGARVRVLGISPDEKWWIVAHPTNPDETCWLGQDVSSFSGDISILGLIKPPPLPEAPSLSVEITRIEVGEDGSYLVEYIPRGFEEQLPGTHLHFFFNTVQPEDSGMGSSGDRLMHGGPSPFNGYKVGDTPEGATEMCVLVAEPNHSIIMESGNCMPLPEVPSLSAEITNITLDEDGSYIVEYITQGFEEQLPGTHLHFFFNTVQPEDSGMGSSGDRLMHGGPSPFSDYKVGDKPAGATEMCVLVAEPNHSIILDSGSCMLLP